tara:strand:- start:535 stop:1260 length:726 start_codon:yes stop_codon:yes gene_type:complete
MQNKHPISMQEERILVEKAKSGCESSFEELVKNDTEASKSFIRKYFSNEDYVEEAYSQGLLKAWLKLGNFKGKCRFRTWLCRIMKNAALDQIRRDTRVEKIDISSLDGNVDDSDENKDARAFHHYKELSLDSEVNKNSKIEYANFSISLLEKYIDNLPKKLKDCLLLYTQGYSYEEISKIKDIPIGTVMSRIFCARNKFKKLLSSKLKNTLTNAEVGAILEHELLSNLLQGKSFKGDKSRN